MTGEASLVPLSQASAVEALGAGYYRATISDAYVVGAVPCGGYVATCLMEAVREHMGPRNQPDALCAHFDFLDRTVAGPAIIRIDDVKLGRQLSTVHVTLYQRGLMREAPWITSGVSIRKLVAYVTCVDAPTQHGVTLATTFSLSNPPRPIDLEEVARRGSDEHWIPYGARDLAIPGFDIRLWDQLEFYVPRHGQHSPSVVDVWLRLACGEPFTHAALAFVADAWPHIIEGYRRSPGQPPAPNTIAATSIQGYATVVFNLDVKRGLPPPGAQWLRMRVEAKEIRDGKLDLETLIYDPDGNLVATSQHVNLVLGGNRNRATHKDKSRI